METKRTLGVCMIVKNEASCLNECLSRVQMIADEIRIADTGSTDDTILIANQYGALVERYEWDDNFSNARNYILEKMTTDWVLMLDADEFLLKESIPRLCHLLETGTKAAYRFVVRNYKSKDATTDYGIHVPVRLIQNRMGAYYEGAVHEQLKVEQNKEEFPVVEIILDHYGYTKEAVNRKRTHERNRALIKKELIKDPCAFYFFLMGKEYQAEKNYVSAKQYYMIAFYLLSEFERNQYFVLLLYYQMIHCLIALGETESAQSVVTRARTQYPESNEFYYLFGRVLQQIGKNKEAIAVYRSCIERKKAPRQLQFNHGIKTFYPLYRMGQIYEEEKNYSIAKRYFYTAYECCKEQTFFLYRAMECSKKECEQRQKEGSHCANAYEIE